MIFSVINLVVLLTVVAIVGWSVVSRNPVVRTEHSFKTLLVNLSLVTLGAWFLAIGLIYSLHDVYQLAKNVLTLSLMLK